MKYFVNFLSIFRIFVAFAIIPTMMFNLYQTTFILFTLGAISDWFDGYLARKYDCCTKLGGVMDHIGDKLLVCNMLILLPFIPIDLTFIASFYTPIIRKLWFQILHLTGKQFGPVLVYHMSIIINIPKFYSSNIHISG